MALSNLKMSLSQIHLLIMAIIPLEVVGKRNRTKEMSKYVGRRFEGSAIKMRING
jgi:hypothetical protein